MADPLAGARADPIASLSMRAFFERFRLFLWGIAAGVVGLYAYGLFLGIYGPLELGLISIACLGLIVLFAWHEIRVRRELKTPEGHERHARSAHTQRERRGF